MTQDDDHADQITESIIPAEATAIAEASNVVGRFLSGASLDRISGDRLRLVIEELVTNILQHGNPTPDSNIRLTISGAREGSVEISLRDRGQPFDPRRDCPTDSRDQALDERPIGKLGWPLILQYCRIENYERTRAGENSLTLRFQI